jgi:hypothetical protein
LISLLLEEMAKNATAILKANDLTHTGTMGGNTGAVLWGLRYPDPTLLLYEQEEEAFVPVMRWHWEEITDGAPPWPWNAEGTALVIPEAQAAEPPE